MDTAELDRSEQSLRLSEERYRALFDSMDEAYCVIDMMFDGEGIACDYRFLEVNAAFIKMTGWTHAAGTLMRDIAPNHEEHWFQTYGRVAVTGEPIRFVQKADILEARWFDLFAFRLGGADSRKVAVLFSDITEPRRARDALAIARTELGEMIDLAPSFMTVYRGPTFVIEVANDAYRRLTGQRELIGLTLRQAFPEVEGQGFFELVERVYATGEPWAGSSVSVMLHLVPGGPLEERFVDLVYQALRAADGAITGVFAHGIDITERKRAEEALRRAAEHAERQSRVFDTTLSAMTDFVYTFDRAGRFLYANKALLNVFGLTLAELIGKDFFDLDYPDEIATRLRRQIGQVFDSRQGVVDEAAYTAASGVAGHLEYILRPVLGGDGRTELVAGSARDITERKRAEQELKDVDRRKTEFLAMLAHELRNPLAPIRSAVQFLRLTDGRHEAAGSMFAMMERQVAQMARLVDDLLDVSRISRGKIELRLEPVELVLLLQQAVEAARPFYESLGRELGFVPPAGPIHLHADPTRLAQIVGNLLNNACKFSERGGHVRLSVTAEAGRAVVRIGDDGIGISAAQLPSIFDMFTQLDTSLERTRGGLGIGLTLVKDLVELHGGAVEARSDGAGRGSEFVVRLPMGGSGAGGNLVPGIADGTVAKRQGGPAQSTAPARLRILVVDDNVDAATLLTLLLELSGHEVAVVHDGLDAVAADAASRFDVVLLDIGLPRLDGYDVARRIRADRGSAVLLVALTGWGQDDDRRRASEAGFDAHLTKPVDYDDLTRLLAQRSAGRARPS